jgi:hypothetical protein
MGHLTHISRGRYGMDAVIKYLPIAVDQPGMLHDPMMLKLERLRVELEGLRSVPLREYKEGYIKVFYIVNRQLPDGMKMSKSTSQRMTLFHHHRHHRHLSHKVQV